MWKLLRTRCFGPFFWVQALGALNDNLFKNGLALYFIYRLSQDVEASRWWVNLAAGLFILPFFLFSAIAGELADRLDKGRLIRWVKFHEILVMGFAALAFWQASPVLLLIAVFLMGAQSAFFGPVKYSLLPDCLQAEELPAGNALVETGTFLAILLGTLGASLLAALDGLPEILMALVLGVALAGWLVSLAIPELPAANPALKVIRNPLRALLAVMRALWHNRAIHQPVLGISFFWFYGAFVLTQLPAWNRWHLGGNETATGLLLLIFAVGIAIGALFCARLSHRTGLLPLATAGLLGLCLFTLDLGLASPPSQAQILPLAAWLQQPGMARIALDLLGLSLSGGLFVVPMYTLLQQRARREALARMVAANNVLNALFMVLAAMLGMALPAVGLDMAQGFVVVAGLSLGFLLLLKIPVFQAS